MDAATSHVEEARKWAELLILAHMISPSDTISRATERASRKTGIPKSVFNRLRYKHPHDIWTREYLQLRDAWTAHKAMNRW